MYSSAYQDPRGGHNRSSINQDFFKDWSPKMAYILGFIVADGAIEDVQKSSRTCYLSISASIKDLSILEQIKIAMGSNHNLYRRKPRISFLKGDEQYLSKESFTLRIGSKLIYNDLLNLGVTPRKSLTILFPQVPTKYFNFFLRGYFDGDGTIYLINKKYPRMIFTSGSNKFLNGLSKVLADTLLIPIKNIYTQTKDRTNPCYQLHYNAKASKKILEFMYQDLDKAPYLKRKYQIYQKYLSQNN